MGKESGMDRTHAKTGKHAVAVGIIAHCFMLLKKLRTEEGLTQDQLALLVETSTDTIGRIIVKRVCELLK